MKFSRINLEIINSCNLKCSFCPTLTRNKLKLTVEQFKHISTQLRDITNELVLHLLGEPLSHPELSEIIEESSNLGLPVNIVTNGVLLNEDKGRILQHPIVRQVSVSLQSFANNFPDVDPTVYIKRVKAFVDDALGNRPDLYINLRFWDLEGYLADNTNHNQKMRELIAKEFGFEWDQVNVDIRHRKNFRLRGRLYLHFDSRFDWPDMNRTVLQETGFCHGLKGHFGIHVDGTVVPCCLDHKADIPLGNILKEPIADILNSPRATAMREGFKAGVLVEDLCKRCGYISRFEKPKKIEA